MKKIISFLISTLMTCFFVVTTVSAEELHGVDVSHWNDTVNFERLKTEGNGDFAYIKATDGYGTQNSLDGFYDKCFKINSEGAEKANVPWGAYHFFRPYNIESAKYQADMFWNTIKGTGYSLRPAIDIEVAEGQQKAVDIRAILQAFITEFESLSKETPVIYTYTNYIPQYSLTKEFATYSLWQSDFRGYCGKTDWQPAMWQYGIENNIDLNVMYNPSEFFKNYSSQTTTVTQPSFNGSSTFTPQINSKAGKQFAVLDEYGTPQQGHYVFKNDLLKIIGIDYNRQIAEIMYPVKDYWVTAFIKNDEVYLHNTGYNAWHNGSTSETVYNVNGKHIGTIFPHEKATVLGKSSNGMTAVLYSTSKGSETKSGFVKFKGLN